MGSTNDIGFSKSIWDSGLQSRRTVRSISGTAKASPLRLILAFEDIAQKKKKKKKKLVLIDSLLRLVLFSLVGLHEDYVILLCYWILSLNYKLRNCGEWKKKPWRYLQISKVFIYYSIAICLFVYWLQVYICILSMLWRVL